jgi:SAM-dependent methyltransferase
MKNFSGEYAEQYDTIHSQKNYQTEVGWIKHELDLRSLGPQCSILDFGCGTGSHANLLRKQGFDAWGYDQNPDMIQVAKKKSGNHSEYFTSELGNLIDDFHVVYSLFDVVNYQVNDEQLKRYLNQLNSKLIPGGLLILDSWNREVVMKDPPQKTTRNYFFAGKEYLRIVSPSTTDDFLTTRLVIELVDVGLSQVIKSEEHIMRAYSSNELSEYLSEIGFKNIRIFQTTNWNLEPTELSWRFGLSAVKD